MAAYKNNHKPYGPYERFFKRPLDIIFALLALIILLIPMSIISVLVKINLGEPVIFRQKRPGKNEKVFNLLKFRTMTDAKDKKGKLLPDEKRLTKFGKFLRSTSLDELPEIFNILVGHMSFVGPRPLLVEYLPYYKANEKHRHDVRPGLTGLAQVNGRNTLSWEDKFKLDLKYVNKITFATDASILWKTFLKVIKRSDVQMGNQLKHGKLNVERAK
ncbi:sugar transferase [Candidatus Saccharibacteria bacterium]|nr:sugar transferase [Candidatus Saccharibacteria bacterium]